ncbi:MAG: YceD family protein [Terriglobales bacterium]
MAPTRVFRVRIIEVKELRLHPVPFAMQWSAGKDAALSEVPEITGELRFEGKATLVGEGMRLQGHVRGDISPSCSRCLEPIPMTVDRDVDLLYEPEALIGDSAEVEIHPADTEVAFFSGKGVDLEEVAREQILLALPMQPLCMPNCRGLCPRCGANLNQGACACAPAADDRWSALKTLRPPQPK